MDLELVLRTSALLVAARVVTTLLVKAAPATRHLIWHISIIAVLLAPVLAPWAPRINVPLVRTVPAVPGTRVPGAQVPAAEMPGATASLFVAAVGFAIGCWFLIGWVASGVRVRRALPAPDAWIAEARAAGRRLGLAHPVEVKQFAEDGSPHVAGFFRSVVLMPAAAATWSSEDRQAALVHELTHIRRGDRRTQALTQLACAIYWFNPLMWHASAALARERERACDAEVLRLGARPSSYATLLLDIARITRPAWTMTAALSMARPTAIEGRLLTILGPRSMAPWCGSRWLVATGVAVMASVVLGAQPTMQEMPPAVAASPRIPAPATDRDDRRQPAITKTLVAALGDEDAQVREKAALGLAFTPGADVIDPLLTALGDADGQVREKAAIGLAFRRDPRIVPPLITAMSDRDSHVREKAAIALGASGDPRALGALQRAATDPDWQVREKAVAGLLLLGVRQ